MQQDIKRMFEVCVIGGGPAGMTAAARCAEGGASVCLIDEQPALGGQIYRAIQENGHPAAAILGPDYLRGAEVLKRVNAAKIAHIKGATLWRIDKDKRIYWSRDGKAAWCEAKQIIIATGALERPFPFPGWTLPGVMTAGACQIMLKTAGVVPEQAVMVGTGPLLYLLAGQLIDAGFAPKAIVDTQQPANYVAATKFLTHAWQGKHYLAKGLKLMAKIRRAGVKHYTRATEIEAVGEGAVQALQFKVGNQPQRIDTQTVLAHIGVIPNVQLTRAMGLSHHWDAAQVCWRPTLDAHYQTAMDGVAVAGDSGGIGGAMVAELQGELSALQALKNLGLTFAGIDGDIATLRQRIRAELAVRPFLDALYPPPSAALSPSDRTIVCRCEEVTAGEVRKHAKAGANGINQIKTFTRCGMGPCQGRYCGQTVAQLISEVSGEPMEKVGYYRIRNPIKPLKLGELASLTPLDKSYLQKQPSKEVTDEQHSKA